MVGGKQIEKGFTGQVVLGQSLIGEWNLYSWRWKKRCTREGAQGEQRQGGKKLKKRGRNRVVGNEPEN